MRTVRNRPPENVNARLQLLRECTRAMHKGVSGERHVAIKHEAKGLAQFQDAMLKLLHAATHNKG